MRAKVVFSEFKNKKVLIFGLGILGGGVATTNWFIKHGAKVRITDGATQDKLAGSIKKIKGKFELSLGGHKKEDVDWCDIVAVNPAVSIGSEFIQYATKQGKKIENEATLFFRCFTKPVVAVTGTRGKTSTVAWINHFLSAKLRASQAGNSTTHQFLKIADKKNLDIAVAEVPSFHLELAGQTDIAPHVALITNIFQDHLNRHGTIENYALTKGNIFKNQTKEDFLILNKNDKWTPRFLKLNPQANVYLFSEKRLTGKENGIFISGSSAIFKKGGTEKAVLKISSFAKEYGMHNTQNLLAAGLASHLAGIPWGVIQKMIKTIPEIPFREQTIYKNKKLRIINDTAATSPEGGIVAIRRFKGSNTILIAGGTDRDLDFKEWAKEVRRHIGKSNVILLAGTATDKMLKVLSPLSPPVFDTLNECFDLAIDLSKDIKPATILFSPACKSFEKFKNEYDRGEKFNRLVKRARKLLV